MMEAISTLTRSDIITNRRVLLNLNIDQLFPERTAINPVIDNLIAEGGEYFLHYLNFLGLTNDSNLMVLSSRHNYYNDYDELQGVSTLINLKKLNLIKYLDSFIFTIHRGISPKTNFIGCFSERKTQKGMGLFSRKNKGFNNFPDSWNNHDLNKNEVLEILEVTGFKIINIKEMNGLTFFYAQKVSRPIE